MQDERSIKLNQASSLAVFMLLFDNHQDLCKGLTAESMFSCCRHIAVEVPELAKQVCQKRQSILEQTATVIRAYQVLLEAL